MSAGIPINAGQGLEKIWAHGTIKPTAFTLLLRAFKIIFSPFSEKYNGAILASSRTVGVVSVLYIIAARGYSQSPSFSYNDVKWRMYPAGHQGANL